MAQDSVSREVAALIQQREQYRAFLVRLEERADAANPRAYERVRKDYEAKLRAISEQLVKHVAAVRKALEDAEAAVTDLEVRRDAKAEEVEEARLRHSVGEYGDDKEWKAVERKVAKELRDLESAVERQNRSVINLTEILEQIEAESKAETARPAPPAPAPSRSASGTTPEPPSKPVRRVRTPGQQVEDTPPESTPAQKGLQLEDLDSLDLAAAPGAPGGASKSGGDAADELRFLESLSLAPEEAEAEQASSPLAFLSRKGKGRTETIICPRCSAANDPAEWYCAECGEELPAG